MGSPGGWRRRCWVLGAHKLPVGCAQMHEVMQPRGAASQEGRPYAQEPRGCCCAQAEAAAGPCFTTRCEPHILLLRRTHPASQALVADGLAPGVQLSKMLADILLDTTGGRTQHGRRVLGPQ